MTNGNDIMTVKLENCRFFGRHGVMNQETVAGNEFIAGVTVEYAITEPIEDDLDRTVSYADLYDILKTEMDRPRKLLETVAQSVAEEIKLRFPNLMKIEVAITKVTPPIPGISGSATVKFSKIF